MIAVIYKRKYEPEYCGKCTPGSFWLAGSIRLDKKTLHHVIYGHYMYQEPLIPMVDETLDRCGKLLVLKGDVDNIFNRFIRNIFPGA